MNTLRHDTGSPPGPPGLDDGVQELLACLAPGAVPRALHDFLAARIEADGLADFVEQRLAAFNRAVGVAWVGGGLGSHAEHHYSSAVQAVVQRHLQMCEPRPFRSRVVLTTPPGELHGLGLLAVQAALTLQGAECFNLGLQTPVSEVVQVVKDRAITLVAISASIVLPPGVAGAYLLELRRALPKACAIWVGGEGYVWLRATRVAGVKSFRSVSQAVKVWQKMTQAARPPVAPGPPSRRRRADARAMIEASPAASGEAAASSEALQRTLNELQVHQIELEMQNEELRQTQDRLDGERARYFELYDLAPVGYCTISANGMILKANLTFARMLGLAKTTILAKALSRYIRPLDQDDFYLLRQRIMQTQEPQECDVRLLRADGAHTWVHLQATVAGNEEGGSSLRLALSDINELKKAQQDLIDSEHRYRTLAEGAPAPLLVHDSKEIVYVNPAAIRMFGASSEADIFRAGVLKLVHPQDRDITLQRMRLSAQQRSAAPMFEHKLLKLDGTPLIVEVHSTSIVYDGAPAVQVAMNDITEHRNFEKRQLGAIEHERKRISREVHDQLGQVFTALKLIIQSLPRGALPKEQDSAVMQALETGIAATRRITAELRPRILDDLGLTAALQDLCEQMLGVVDLDFTIDVDAQESLAPSQSLSLFRITQEALTNVVKHAKARHVGIGGGRGKYEYEFRIQDDGLGFMPHSARADAMGLISMQERARIMGGRCNIESTLTQGTLIEISLPLEAAHDDEAAAG